ncbi:permease [Acidovorax sp. Leaf76]|uniref:esterase/lipase family protein n=1 Tax=unclassified Acidovorax TaxID=2684926 RepID=UPI0006F4AF21|nr:MULTISPECIES: alpha/beta fold hydrolase [unclassified Acidovorax]KQO24009.1 permease [Acidovorax sp. Leaf76]KQO38461.1 permease [Acidovorax sp. Leaf84]KQS40820.1 permease [Acidovorax sp. Leaf191]
MIARWQRVLILFILAAMAAWLAWQWPRSPQVAIVGALVPLAVYLLVMAVEFVLMHITNRTDAAPRARLAQVVAAWWAEVCVALALFGWRQPFRHQSLPDWLPAQPTGRRGVVLVHGFMCNRGLWLPWFAHLKARGHAYVAVNLEPVMGSIDEYANTIDDAVARMAAATGQAPVLVCHSMGGLAARAWLRAHQADGRVHRVLTLGTPHGGTWLGRFSRAVNGRQMSLAGEWVGALQKAEPAGRAALFTCWYSNCDNIVFPATTASLPGADNRFVEGVAHVQMAFHPGVMAECLDEVGRN